MHSFINRLPNELLVHILSFLDSPSPSPLQTRLLHHDPELISRPLQLDRRLPLKTASLVCRLWRRSLLQLLFRHVVWSFCRLEKPGSTYNNGSNDVAADIPLLNFLSRNGLDLDVQSLTLFIDPPNTDEDQLWGVLPSGQDAAHPDNTTVPSPSSDGDLPRQVKETRLWDNNWLWETLFSQLDPLRITLVSYPHVLASLLSREVDLSSEWAFTSHKHTLSLSRSSRAISYAPRRAIPPPPTTTSSTTPIPSTLFHARPWTSLLVNEGSFVPVYSAYEFFHYVPPTLLPVILDASDPSFAPLRDHLTSFSYVATFPLSRHIRDVVVRCCPPVEHLYLQMMPRAADAFWQDAKLAHVDITDLWLECDMAYSIVMREVFKPDPDPHGSGGSNPLSSLRAFECGDTATEEAWTMAMQYVVMNGIAGWKLKQPGHFVRQDVRSRA